MGLDICDFVADFFGTDYLNENGRSVSMLRRKLINGSFEWIGVSDFLRTNGPPWTANILDPYADWGSGGTSTCQKLSSGSGVYSDSVIINWNRLARDFPI